MKIEIFGIKLPEISPEMDLEKEIVKRAEEFGGIKDGDVIVVTSKAYLKSRGKLIDLSKVRPSFASKVIARISGKDPVEVELVLRASEEILLWINSKAMMEGYIEKISKDKGSAMETLEKVPSLLMVLTPQGLICSDAGLDYSNLPPGHAICNSEDFDKAAREIRERIERISGKNVAVVISDTELSATGKIGSIDVALGCSGIHPVTRKLGEEDRYGRKKFGGVDLIADEIASAAALLMGQTSEGIPVVVIRGLKYERSDEGISSITLKDSRRSPFSAIRTALIRLIFKLFYKKGD